MSADEPRNDEKSESLNVGFFRSSPLHLRIQLSDLLQ
ncbi:MAG: hypothetical protein RJB13_1382, partial [Pseudomonadota bacterium]